uniref:Calcineurin-like phosphoesterase domain-containing protein n=1 Tax=Panagrolaimus sp. JU765 TaxID=591449 RepID=A0AC34QRK5_9BILA
MLRIFNGRKIGAVLLPLLAAFVFNEYLIYHFVISRCDYPKIIHRTRGRLIENNYSRIMLLADTHLLGVRRGHWLDKLRREWQMRRSFQTAMSWLTPNAVFFLGDSTDEGQWANEAEFNGYADRFDELFAVPESTKRFVVVGNHDVGFHYALMPQSLERFSARFGVKKSVDYVNIGGNHFVLINSMAMEGDGCRLCHTAEMEVKQLKKRFDCSRTAECDSNFSSNYSRPIILQHFPLFRSNDLICEDSEDLAPSEIRQEAFREKWECLSKDSTNLLLNSFRPRAVFGGHSHFTCSRYWSTPFNFYEYTIASFSWRNNRWPSFLLLTVSPTELKVAKCMIPHEHTTFFIYGLAALCSLFVAIFQWWQSRKSTFESFPVEEKRTFFGRSAKHD